MICKFAYKTGATINDFNKWLSDPEFINNFRKEIIKYIAEKKEITFVGCDEVMFTINFSDYLLGAFILKIIVEKLHLTLLYNPYFFSVLNYTDSTTLGVNSIIAEKNVSEELSIEEHKRALCSCSCDPILPINPIEIESFPMGNHENSVK